MNDISSRVANLSPAKLALFKLQIEKKKGAINFVSSSLGNTSPTSVNDKSSPFDLSAAYVRFQVWKREFQTDSLIRIEKHLVHKDEEQNVFIARLEKLQDDVIIGQVVQDLSHPFFYEHPKDHVPGLYILEATRQFATALSHIYYDVPIGKAFILDELQAQFYRFAETSLPLFIVAKISDKVQANGRMLQMYSNGFVVQNEAVIAEVSGLFKIFEPTSYNNIRSKVVVAKTF